MYLEGAEPWAQQVREQLGRIVRSPEFARSERLKRFLTYIVNETLDGRSDRLKAYSIAIEVFQRPESFDPQLDPLVRMEAARLRKVLEAYYLTEGQDDPVVISVPKGAYVPLFAPAPTAQPQGELSSTAAAASEPPAPAMPVPRPPRARARVAALVMIGLAVVAGAIAWRAMSRDAGRLDAAALDLPAVAVLPFRHVGADGQGRILAEGMADSLIDQLARFSDLKVLGRESARLIASVDDPGKRAGSPARYLLEGTVTSTAGRALVSARLVDSRHQQIVWSLQLPVGSTTDAIGVQVEIASEIARALAQPYGAVFRLEAMRAQRTPSDWSAYNCTLSYYSYRMAISREGNRAAKACLSRAVEQNPDFGAAWAMLALVHLDELRLGAEAGTTTQDVIAKALAAADTAVRLDPENVRALQAQMMARYFARDVDGGRSAGERALAINPNDTELLGEFGARVGQAGDWDRGSALMRKVLAQNPANDGYYHGMIAFSELMRGDVRAAADHAERANLQSYPLFIFIRMLISAQLGQFDDAVRYLDQFAVLQPRFLTDLEAQFDIRNMQPRDRATIRDTLAKVQSAKAAKARP